MASYVTLLVVMLRQESPQNLWMFAVMVVVGPYLILGAFWILQQLLAQVSFVTEKLATFFISTLGLPSCLLICLHHDTESLLKITKVVKNI